MSVVDLKVFKGAAGEFPLNEYRLRQGGRVLLSDPFRGASMRRLEVMEANGLAVTLGKWRVGEEYALRPVGLFELTRP